MRENWDERKNEPQALPYRGMGRPQIVLIGNGLERSGKAVAEPDGNQRKGKSWNDLMKDVTVKNHVELPKKDLDKLPFPLKYHLLSMSKEAPYPMRRDDRAGEDRRLSKAVNGIGTVTNDFLAFLPKLYADHYFTTNYTYSLEYAFDPTLNFSDREARKSIRFNYNPKISANDRPCLERSYRLYTGYLGTLPDGTQTGLWHIHGECGVPSSIILGHDGYGRLLSRIVPVCGDYKKYKELTLEEPYGFRSWPELFLFADVYIVGLGLGVSEFDLWWLLRRKQREERADGRVYFYTNDPAERHKNAQDNRIRDQMLQALGVIVNPDGITRGVDHSDFYKAALDSIQARIAENRKAR